MVDVKKYKVGQSHHHKIRPSKIFDKVVPDHVEVEGGGPPPFPRVKAEWDREKKERIAQLRRQKITVS